MNLPLSYRRSLAPQPGHGFRRMETWAAAVPLLCAAHCIAAPLLVALAPRLAASERHERAAMAGSLCLALAAVVLGVRVHRRAAPLLLVGTGAACWMAPLATPLVPEQVAAVAASLAMAAGTLWSAHLRHRVACPRCGCPASEPRDGAPRSGGAP